MANDELLEEISLFTSKRRVESELDDIFDFGGSPLERDDIQTDSRGADVTVEPSGSLTDDEFDSFRKQTNQSRKVDFNGQNNIVDLSELDTPKPSAVHERRSEDAKKMDSRREAQLTTDPQTYASNPGRFDYPFVDTAPSQDESLSNEIALTNDLKPDFDALSDIDDL